MHACVEEPIGKDSENSLEHIGKERIKIEIANVKVM